MYLPKTAVNANEAMILLPAAKIYNYVKKKFLKLHVLVKLYSNISNRYNKAVSMLLLTHDAVDAVPSVSRKTLTF